ncbi:MAG: helix-turn-helix domain-containing protein, partial [Puniceicoccales bacterium]|nr:helix-turn-helix domain-containing protein [Puniceicoccales bacterium]
GLFALLFERKNSIVYRRELIRGVWGPYADPHSRSLDQYIVRVRALFRRCGGENQLRAIHEVGYMLDDCK